MGGRVFKWSILIFVLHLHRYSNGRTSKYETTAFIEGITGRSSSSKDATTLRHHCRVSSDSSRPTPSRVYWYFQKIGEEKPSLLKKQDGLRNITHGKFTTSTPKTQIGSPGTRKRSKRESGNDQITVNSAMITGTATIESTTFEQATTKATTPSSMTTESVTDEAKTSDSTITESITTQPTNTKSMTTDPMTFKPTTVEATTTESMTAETVTTGANTPDSMTTQSMAFHIATNEAMNTGSLTSEPMTTDSKTNEPETAEAATTDSTTTESITPRSANTMTISNELMTFELASTDPTTTGTMTDPSMTFQHTTVEATTTEPMTSESATAGATTSDSMTFQTATTAATNTASMLMVSVTVEANACQSMYTEPITTETAIKGSRTIESVTVGAATSDSITPQSIMFQTATTDSKNTVSEVIQTVSQGTKMSDTVTSHSMLFRTANSEATNTGSMTSESVTLDATTTEVLTTESKTFQPDSVEATSTGSMTTESVIADESTTDSMTSEAETNDPTSTGVIINPSMTIQSTTLEAATTESMTTESMTVGATVSDSHAPPLIKFQSSTAETTSIVSMIHDSVHAETSTTDSTTTGIMTNRSMPLQATHVEAITTVSVKNESMTLEATTTESLTTKAKAFQTTNTSIAPSESITNASMILKRANIDLLTAGKMTDQSTLTFQPTSKETRSSGSMTTESATLKVTTTESITSESITYQPTTNEATPAGSTTSVQMTFQATNTNAATAGQLNTSVIAERTDKEKNFTDGSTNETTIKERSTISTKDFTSSPFNIFFEYGMMIDNFRNGTGLSSSEAVTNITRSLSEYTNSSDGLSSDDLINSIVVVDKLAQMRKEKDQIPPTMDEINSVIQTISNILQPVNTQTWSKTNKTMAAMLMSSADTYGGCACRAVDRISTTNDMKEDAENIALESFCASSMDNNLRDRTFWMNGKWNEDRMDRISIDFSAIDKSRLKENFSLNIWSVYFRNIDNYLPNTSNFLLDSRVLSLSTSRQDLNLPFKITFQHNKVYRSKRVRRCVFWKTDPDKGGGWSGAGCRVVETDAHRTVCSCDHLTNFAVLMSRNPSRDPALSILSTVLCTGSVAALVLTIIIQYSKSHRSVLLINLYAALIVAYLVFLVGSEKFDRQENNKAINGEDGCIVLAALLNYFFLAAFFMMLAEGIQLFNYVTFVFHARRKYETALLVVTAWVLPMIIVAISLWVTRTEGYGIGLACWLSYNEDGNQLIWAFIAPAFFVLVVNGIIIVIVFVKISRSKIASSKDDHKTKTRKMLWNIAVLFPVLGISWLFGVLTVIEDNVVLQYIFAIVNSAQGIVIFIFHTLVVNEKFNKGVSSFCYQCTTCIDIRKANKKRKLTNKLTAEKTTKAKPSALNLGSVNSSNGLELDNQGFSYSTEMLPSVGDSSEKSPTSATVDTFVGVITHL